ncbi:MAG TPA: MFS transporter [Chloroflexota bacterium]|nr:MFS transporter [Chloroflexota bacterium]
MALTVEPQVVAVEAPPQEPKGASGGPGMPALIKRNTLLLTAAEAFVGTGQQMVPTLSALIVMHLSGLAALAGIGSSITGLTRALVSYPSGRLADIFGRKKVLVAGLLISLVGAVALGLSVLQMSFAGFVLALLVFGLGNGISQQQRRLSAADFFPPERRGRGLGFVLTGSLVGALGGPVIIGAAGALAHGDMMGQLWISWMLVPLVIIPSLALILLIRPDPSVIARDLGRYWPGYEPSPQAPRQASDKVTLLTFARNYPHVVAFASMFVLFGNMSMMMSLAPMTMTGDGMGLTVISLTVTLHVIGMYGLSVPVGRLADRVGRRPMLLAAVALSTAGTVFVALTHAPAPVILGLFVVGMGWCAGNVSTAAIVADTTPVAIRGQAMGANSSCSAVASVGGPLLGGLLLQVFGPVALVGLTLIAVIPTTVLILRLRETAPGQFAHPSRF